MAYCNGKVSYYKGQINLHYALMIQVKKSRQMFCRLFCILLYIENLKHSFSKLPARNLYLFPYVRRKSENEFPHLR